MRIGRGLYLAGGSGLGELAGSVWCWWVRGRGWQTNWLIRSHAAGGWG